MAVASYLNLLGLRLLTDKIRTLHQEGLKGIFKFYSAKKLLLRVRRLGR